jgi:hypothetical protein
MSRDRRKPWEIPITYEEDRFPDKPSRTLDDQVGGTLKPDPDLVHERVMNPTGSQPAARNPRQPSKPSPTPTPRPSNPGGWRNSGGFASNDDEPLNYGRGEHDGELDCDDKDDPYYDDNQE